MLSLTPRAVSAIRSVCPDQPLGLRIAVDAGGCAGLQYRMALVPEAACDDEVIEVDGLRVFIDRLSTMWLAGVSIDFVDGEQGAGFDFDNPNAAGKCACAGGCG